jgi:hypothetical protein
VRQLANLAHPINHTLSGASNRLVSLLQKSGENRKILYRILFGVRVGMKINNVRWRMPGKISPNDAPGIGQDAAASI